MLTQIERLYSLGLRKIKTMEIALLAFGMFALIALARSIKELDRKEDEFTNRFEE